MEPPEIIRQIRRLKREKAALILAHNYQVPEVQDAADFVGDSLELARAAAGAKDCRMIVFCGVRFMAETAKILSPDKKVLLPVPDAGCPLADMADAGEVAARKRELPGAWVVSYVNTTAEVKALTDVCCTSSNAAAVVRNVPADTVLFLPDRNLCWYVRQRVPTKNIVCWDGYCYVHRQFSAADIEKVRRTLPEAEILVHPECDPEVQEQADGIYSTSGMLRRAAESPARQFVIGTEEGLLHRLKKLNPGKEFYSLGTARMCPNMKRTKLENLASSLSEETAEIFLPPELMDRARAALERMLEYG